MIARSFWGAKADKDSAEKRAEPAAESPSPAADDLLDSRIDEEGSVADSRGGRRRRGRRSSPPPDSTGVDELDIAVQKLSEGLEAIERQSRAARRAAAQPSRPAPPVEPEPDTEDGFVGHSLDRLEARLEALSKRLQQRGGAAAAEAASPARRRDEAALKAPLEDEAEEDFEAQLAESRRLAEAEEERRGRGG